MRGGGEIVEVQGGHIVRATGRKDRHSKVCTAKGPRDRRVRLAAHTAIQFYDVQDRLGYDRPSKAVDWLIMNAKAAIDELAPLPAWQPTNQVDSMGDSGKRQVVVASEPDPDPEPDPGVSTTFRFGETSRGSGSSFLPSSMDSDSIADTIKSFFPMSAVPAAPSPSSSHPVGVGGVGVSGYHGYPQDLLSRSSSQELRLSLQSFQDQIFHHQHHQHHRNDHDSLVFDTAAPTGWPEQSQRMMVPWNLADSGNRGGYMFNTPPLPLPPPAVSPHGQFFAQRGPLQSSNSPSIRPWADPVQPSADHPMFHPIASAIGFASGGHIGFSGFRIPARIQGEEEHDGISDNPSSASSASHH